MRRYLCTALYPARGLPARWAFEYPSGRRTPSAVGAAWFDATPASVVSSAAPRRRCPSSHAARSQRSVSDGELLSIVKNGVRFTGMPGWGGEDDENWKLVLFVRHLPELSDKELELMKEVNGRDTPAAHHGTHQEE